MEFLTSSSSKFPVTLKGNITIAAYLPVNKTKIFMGKVKAKAVGVSSRARRTTVRTMEEGQAGESKKIKSYYHTAI